MRLEDRYVLFLENVWNLASFCIDDEIVKGPTLAEEENLYLTGSVKSPPTTEVFFASRGLYLLVAGILFALT